MAAYDPHEMNTTDESEKGSVRLLTRQRRLRDKSVTSKRNRFSNRKRSNYSNSTPRTHDMSSSLDDVISDENEHILNQWEHRNRRKKCVGSRRGKIREVGQYVVASSGGQGICELDLTKYVFFLLETAYFTSRVIPRESPQI